MLADAASTTGWSAVLVALIGTGGGIVYLIFQQRGASSAATTAAVKAQETKNTVEETKVAVDSVASSLTASLDGAALADLLNQSNGLLAQATNQLLRCEERERQHIAVIRVLGDKVDVLQAKVEAFERVLSAQGRQPPSRAKRTGR